MSKRATCYGLALCVALAMASTGWAASNQKRLLLAGDYDVDTGQGGNTWHSPGGLPPLPKCETVCDPDYHTCAADCFRGAIGTMGGCLAGCRSSYCQTLCN